MHAAILADQPFQIAFRILPLGEAHQGPGAWVEIRGIVVGALEVSDLLAQVVPFHAGDLACLAADALADVDQLCHLRLRRTCGGGGVRVVAERRMISSDCRLPWRSPSGHRGLVFSTLTRNALNSGRLRIGVADGRGQRVGAVALAPGR